MLKFLRPKPSVHPHHLSLWLISLQTTRSLKFLWMWWHQQILSPWYMGKYSNLPKVSQEVILLFGKLMKFVVPAFNFFFLIVFCISPVRFSVTSLYSRFFVCYFCPAQGVCNLVCFQTAHNFMLFPPVKLSYKHPCAFFAPVWKAATNNCHITTLFGKTLLRATILQKRQHCCCRAAGGVLFQECKKGLCKISTSYWTIRDYLKQVLLVMPIFVDGVSALLTAQDAVPEIPIPDGIPCLYRIGSCSHCC